MNEQFARAGAIARIDLAHAADFALGPARVRPALCQVSADGLSETLQPRVMQVLVALAGANGEVVSRDDLIESCWDGRVVGEDAINRTIGHLRKLAEMSNGAFEIQNIPRVGYRLIVAGSPESDARPQSALQVPKAILADSSDNVFKRLTRRNGAIAAGILALSVAAGSAWWFWPRPLVEPAASVAVLPFANLSGGPRYDYFSEGFSEELVDALSSDPRLRVVGRTSSATLKDENEDITAIARMLHVRTIAEGSVRQSGNRVRIGVRLIDAGTGYLIWSGTYDRNISDILSVQDDVARAIAVGLTNRLEPPARHHKIDPAVYRLYLQARQLTDRQTPDSEAKSVRLLKEVTRRQPDFAEGFAELSRAALNDRLADEPLPSDVALTSESAHRALSLDSRNLKARASLALLERVRWNWSAATLDFRVLRAENPNSLQVLRPLRDYYYAMGFPDAAIATGWRALRVDTLDNDYRGVALDAYLFSEGHFKEAIDLAHAILARVKSHPDVMANLCGAFAWTGRSREARDVERRLRGLSTDWNFRLALDECDYQIAINSGDISGARKIVEHLAAQFPDKPIDATAIAELYMLLKDFDRASDWLERAYERREINFFTVGNWKYGTSYRAASPRWKALTQRPLFKVWQAEHDRIAAAIAAHRDPLSLK